MIDYALFLHDSISGWILLTNVFLCSLKGDDVAGSNGKRATKAVTLSDLTYHTEGNTNDIIVKNKTSARRLLIHSNKELKVLEVEVYNGPLLGKVLMNRGIF